MESKRIRSAWEIALEKADRLGQITNEELRKQNEDQYYPMGKGMADKVLDGLPLREIEYQLGKIEAEKREYVQQGLLIALVDNIFLTDIDRTERSLSTILHFRGKGQVIETVGEIERLIRQQSETRRNTVPEANSLSVDSALAFLVKKGISGSAVQPNPLAIESWNSEEGASDTGSENRLELLKEQLRKEVIC